MSESTQDVYFHIYRGVGRIILNRPAAINSLTRDMAIRIRTQLDTWGQDPHIHTVLVTGAGNRGLCAGGDTVALYNSIRDNDGHARWFFSDEYRLNAAISRFPKPYVVIMDGIVMGGGVGLSAHGNVRIVTDRTRIAMPEVGIGFIPDVGGTYLLSRAPGLMGLHVGLTGATFNGADALVLGLADYYLPSHNIDDFITTLINHDLATALDTYSIDSPQSSLLKQQRWIDHCYGYEDVKTIIDALYRYPDLEAHAAGALIATRSPIALSVSLQALRKAKLLPDLPTVLIQEFRISCAALKSHDLVEGIRAQLIEKDRCPHWCPSNLEEVDPQVVNSYFYPTDSEPTFL